MSKKMVLEQLIEENNGYLITSLATAKCDVSRAFLSQYVKEKEMERQGEYYGLSKIVSILAERR